MKSFLPSVLLSLLFLSITYSEVSGNELSCYSITSNGEETETCSGDDVVCLTGIDIESGDVMGKTCGEKAELESTCNKDPRFDCKFCDTDLCNNEKF